MNLSELYRTGKTVITAHRGFSGRYPENTLTAFQKAVEAGADLIEFDLRATRDAIPVVSHDAEIEKTSNGKGCIRDRTLTELKENDFGFIRSKAGKKHWDGAPLTIPSFEEVLSSVPDTLGLNIQIKENGDTFLERVCRLYREHNLYTRGYLTMSTFADARKIRAIDPDIELCILERKRPFTRELLCEMQAFGCRFLQPHRKAISDALISVINAMGFFSNLFYSNTDEDNRRYIALGQQGILTDFPDILGQTIRELEGN